jgi:hypothetical protein
MQDMRISMPELVRIQHIRIIATEAVQAGHVFGTQAEVKNVQIVGHALRIG